MEIKRILTKKVEKSFKCLKTYLKPSNPSSDPLTVKTGALA